MTQPKGLCYTGSDVIRKLKDNYIRFEVTDEGFLFETKNRAGQFQRTKIIAEVGFDLYSAQEVEAEIAFQLSKR